jgi:chlorobactene glucosyltransferase
MALVPLMVKILIFIILPGAGVLFWLKILYLNEAAKHKRIPETENISRPSGTITLIIPARNEENNIRECLTCALNSTYSFQQILVVDDQSSDATAAIVESLQKDNPRIALLRIHELPSRWVGKNNALFQGAQHADSDWLLFIDADVRLHEHAVAQILHYAQQQQYDILSLSPHQLCDKYYEKLLQPEVFTMLNTLFPLHRINTESSTLSAFNGSFILIKKNAYFSFNGHQAVYNAVLEDTELARVARNYHLKFALLQGSPYVSSRMYRNFMELWSGWSRNLYLVIRASQHNVAMVMVCIILVYLYPLLLLLCNSKYAFFLYIIVIAFDLIIRARNKQFPGYSLLAPIAGFILLSIVLNSYSHCAVLRKTVWKKRIYHRADMK